MVFAPPLPAEPRQGVGDNYAQGLLAPQTAPSYPVQEVIDIAKQMDPDAGAAIQQAYDDGDLGFSEFHSDGNYGFHDWNTVCINPDNGLPTAAAALLHEWGHVENCTPPSQGGSGHDDRVGDPCFQCIHAQMTADSFTNVAMFACDAGISGNFGAIDPCDILDDLEDKAREQHAKCAAGSCASVPDVEGMADWGVCPWCV